MLRLIVFAFVLYLAGLEYTFASEAPGKTVSVREGVSGTALSPTRTSSAGAPRTLRVQEKARAASTDYEFIEIDIFLDRDDDNDGFYHRLTLDFDADTAFVESDVYAVIFLSFEGGPWEELVTTLTFTLTGATANDRYVVETDLETGYLTGDYDALIELYEADTGFFVAELGPAQTTALTVLPLEDRERDDPGLIVVSGGGGSSGLGMLTLLSLLLMRRLGHTVDPDHSG